MHWRMIKGGGLEGLWVKNKVPKALNKEYKKIGSEIKKSIINERDYIELWVCEFFGYCVAEGFIRKSRLEGSSFCEMARVIIMTLVLFSLPLAAIQQPI